MKYSELKKILKRSGCFLKRHGTRHDIWYSPVSGCCFTVPRHKKEVPAGTAAAILNDAGIDSIMKG